MKINLNYFSFAKIPNKKAHTIQILKMCDEMSKKFNVNLICDGTRSSNIKSKFNLKNKFKITNIKTSNYRIINIFYKIYNLYKYKRNESDILFTRDVHFAFFGFFFYKKIYLELHQTYLSNNNLSYYFLIFLMKIMKIRKIFISKALYKIYKKKINKIKNFIIAHDASDNHFTKIRSNKILSVGYCGHLYKGRGIDIILSLAEREQKIQFKVLGGFKEDRNSYKKNYLPKNIKFFSHTSYQNVKKFLSSNDILIAPYEKKLGAYNQIDTAKYMSPLKIFEYMSANRAIICSNHTVLKEILNPNVSAFMCDPKNISEWEKKLKVLKNKKKRYFLSTNSYNQFLKNFTWKKRVETIFN